MCFEDGRYQIQWLRKYNLDIAVSRIKSLGRHFQRNRDLLRKYDDVKQNQVRQGIIERVVEGEWKRKFKALLSHHLVLPTKNTTK